MNEPVAPRWTIDWFFKCLERGKREIFTEQVMLGPGLAKELLDRNHGNRGIRIAKVSQMTRDIEAGNWTNNGETIIISNDGHLNDGQHRAEAVWRAGKEIPVIMVFGVSRESQKTVDQGAARTASDVLGMEGVPNATSVSSAARLLTAYDLSEGQNLKYVNRISISDIRKKIESEPDLIENVRILANLQRLRQLTPAWLGFAFTVFKRFHVSDAEKFVRAVATGENLTVKYPAFSVRQRLIKDDRMTKNEVIETLFRGFVAMREGRDIKAMRLTGNLPKLS